jgi:hypothetical protein
VHNALKQLYYLLTVVCSCMILTKFEFGHISIFIKTPQFGNILDNISLL